MKNNKDKFDISSELSEHKGKKLEITSKDQMDKIVSDIHNSSEFAVEDVTKTSRKRNAYPPLKTSTLQQSSANIFGYAAKRTMSIAQKLFEKGLNLNFLITCFTIIVII